MKISISPQTILAERLRRQQLTQPLKDPHGYLELFSLLQPVSPVHNTRPGEPPRLVHRITFDDGELTDRWRAQHIIVKGRFLGGRIGYVLAKDLQRYANAFRRPLLKLNETQHLVFDRVKYLGPLTPRQIKAETGLLNKQIMPALHRLQEAFLVYEDQVNSDWERDWYDFASEWPAVDLDLSWETAAAEVLLRFLRGHVFGTLEQLRDWSRFPVKALAQLVCEMEKNGTIVPQTVRGLGEGFCCAEDLPLKSYQVPPSVFMLHKSDTLVRSHASQLKQRFKDKEVLQYLLVDGAFQGAVVGHWRIGPHDVKDIIVELPPAERLTRREEILNVVAQGYKPPYSHILKYAGQPEGFNF